MAVLTKSAQVESQLRKRILAGEWAAGQRLPAERELYRSFGAGPRRSRAMFFLDDGLAEVALRVVLELGIKVPEELAIVSHANVGMGFGGLVQHPIPRFWDVNNSLGGEP